MPETSLAACGDPSISLLLMRSIVVNEARHADKSADNKGVIGMLWRPRRPLSYFRHHRILVAQRRESNNKVSHGNGGSIRIEHVK